jgi:hypothetical protein
MVPRRFPLKRPPATLQGRAELCAGKFGDDSRGLMASQGADSASQSGTEAVGGGRPGRRGQAFATAARARLGAFLRRHGLGLVTAAAILGGLLLLYAEALHLYRIVTPSGSVSNAAGSVRTGGDQHSWALGVMGVGAAGAALLARVTRQRLPALAAAMLGAIALLVALTVDLPDVTATGVTTELEVGSAEPGAGFWLELVGAIVLTAGAGVLAYLLPPGSRAGVPRTRTRS